MRACRNLDCISPSLPTFFQRLASIVLFLAGFRGRWTP